MVRFWDGFDETTYAMPSACCTQPIGYIARTVREFMPAEVRNLQLFADFNRAMTDQADKENPVFTCDNCGKETPLEEKP